MPFQFPDDFLDQIEAVALAGAVYALALVGRPLSVFAVIGAIMLSGIVVNDGIVLVDRMNQLRRGGLDPRAAAREAGAERLRPILMTTATTVLGLLPMALGLGEGAELRAPLAVTVIGGLAVATALTLIVIPVVYSLLAGHRAMAPTGESGRAAGGPFRLMQVAVERIQPTESRGATR